MQAETLKRAMYAALAHGYSFYPIDQTKHPVVPWAEFQKRHPSPAEIDRWISGRTVMRAVAGFSAIAGPISGNLAALDFDDVKRQIDLDMFAAWKAEIGDVDDLVIHQSPSGGHHLLFRMETLESFGRNLAYVPKPVRENGEEDGREVAIELITSGGITLPPSYNHKYGCYYRRVSERSIRDIATLSPERVSQLVEAARALNQVEEPPKPVPRPSPRSSARFNGEYSTRRTIIQLFNEAFTPEDILTRAGYHQVRGGWARPGGENPTVSILRGGRSYHHNTSDELADGNAHDAFDIFRLAQCGGDWDLATEQAAAELNLNWQPYREVARYQPPQFDPQAYEQDIPPDTSVVIVTDSAWVASLLEERGFRTLVTPRTHPRSWPRQILRAIWSFTLRYVLFDKPPEDGTAELIASETETPMVQIQCPIEEYLNSHTTWHLVDRMRVARVPAFRIAPGGPK